MFPVKSLGCVKENAIECTKLGLKLGWLRDRTLMVIDLDGNFVTGRQKPRMVQVITINNYRKNFKIIFK